MERSWAEWARLHAVPREALGLIHGMPNREIISRVAPHLDLDEAAAVFDRLELNDVDDIVALPGAVEALAVLGHRAAIVTSAGRTLAAARLAAAGIESTAVVITHDDVSHGKPHPDPFLTAAARLGVDAAHCLVVEDAVAGLRAAKEAGAATLAVETSTSRSELEPHADMVVDDLSAVRFQVGTMGVRVTRVVN